MIRIIRLKIILFLLLVPMILFAQDLRKLTIQVEVNNTPDSSEIFICGNIPELGNWRPDEIYLTKTGSNIWEKSFMLPAGKKIEYKITRGTWNTEAVRENGSIPGNNVVIINNDTIIYIKISHWKDQFDYNLRMKITGRVDYYKNLTGKGILPRDLLVWVPPDYSNDSTTRYPVLYMQDGQNLFDPNTAAFGVDWRLDETADSLIKQDVIRPLIIVGLTSTDWRTEEYTDTDTGRAYMNFIVDKVKPFIDSVYRTLSGPENNIVGGSSLGGLISFILPWVYPDIFSTGICMSAAIKINNIDYVKNIEDFTGPHKNVRFYFDTGSDSLDLKLKPGILDMINVLQDKGYKPGKDIFWYFDKNGKHNESSWGKRINLPLLFFFGK